LTKSAILRNFGEKKIAIPNLSIFKQFLTQKKKKVGKIVNFNQFLNAKNAIARKISCQFLSNF
jgi:hypothetical protein